MNDAQILAFNLTMLSVYLAPELQPVTRQCMAFACAAVSVHAAARLLF